MRPKEYDIRRWMVLCENLFEVPRSIIRVGTKLWHGTSAIEDFAIPRGPAWFAPTRTIAQKWAGWADYEHNKPHGNKRILELRCHKRSVCY